MKKPALGRGLEALLGDAKSVFQPVEGAGNLLRYLPVEQLKPGPFQPRRDFDPEKLAELAESVRAQGIVQPIVVRQDPSETAIYQIIAGERRWRAAKIAELHEVPVVVGMLMIRPFLPSVLLKTSSVRISTRLRRRKRSVVCRSSLA